MVTLLEATFFRVGNEEYARLNRSFGLSTLRNRHAHVTGSTIRFRFRGKGGRIEERAVVDRRMAGIVRRCQELPGQLLFQYVDGDGELHAVASEDVNDYLREAAGTEDVSAKDLRTWAATLIAFRAMRARVEDPDGPDHGDRPPGALARAAVATTAEAIGDTVAVTRRSYVHPAVLEMTADDARASRTDSAPTAGLPTRAEELAALRLLDGGARPRKARRPSGRP